MKIRNLAITLMCSVCAGAMLIGCSSDDPTFVKKPKVTLSRTEDGEDARWYVEGKEMSRETFETEVVGNAWIECEYYFIEDDGSLADMDAPENKYLGLGGELYYFDADKIYVVGGPYNGKVLLEYDYVVGDPVGYLPNNMLPIEIDSAGMLTAIQHMPLRYVYKDAPHRYSASYKRLSKISKEDFDKAVETAKEDMKRNHWGE